MRVNGFPNRKRLKIYKKKGKKILTSEEDDILSMHGGECKGKVTGPLKVEFGNNVKKNRGEQS